MSESQTLCKNIIGKYCVHNDAQFYDIKLVTCDWLDNEARMLIFHNISDKIYFLEQLRRIDRYKDSLLATVTHDLKTPLNGIMSYN